MIRAEIDVTGIVQGVGFRPCVYRLARQAALAGSVSNTAAGVHIVLHGPESDIDSFLAVLPESLPPLAVIHSLHCVKSAIAPAESLGEFLIAASIIAGEKTGPVTPDTDVCHNCLQELFDSANRRYLYPFINCTDCGPRYTLIEKTPFDRQLTAMKEFGLCDQCRREYEDPGDRRFHAQATCCPACGPALGFYDRNGQEMSAADVMAAAVQELKAGRILAIKGLGGFHLAVDAANHEAVARLRARKGRPDKPLAVMAADLQAINSFASPDELEKKLLHSSRKPIVLLQKRSPCPLADNVAPNNGLIGAMLPYTPIHYLLYANRDCPVLVMTSGNLSGSPIIKTNQEALERLGHIADFFIMHNRSIATRTDDSVLRVGNGILHFYRRARSFVPTAIALDMDAGATLALGAMLKNTICLTRGREAFVSQHIGDLDNLDTQLHQQETIRHFIQLQRAEPDLLVHDLHPDYPSTRYALQQKKYRTAGVQHHHAHAVSCMAENQRSGPVIAVTLDGSGYGPDNTIWGGEVLIARYDGFDRAAHLKCVPMPGSEAAIREPWRMAVSYLYSTFGAEFMVLPVRLLSRFGDALPVITAMMEKGINAPQTSSCGRLFDAVAALINLRYSATYEGQAAAELEQCINPNGGISDAYPYAMETGQDGILQLDPAPMIRSIVEDVAGGIAPGVISNRFHNGLARLCAAACVRVREQGGLNEVVLSGGVFQNMIMEQRLTELLEAQDFRVFSHRLLPANDGGLSLGQAVAGRALSKK